MSNTSTRGSSAGFAACIAACLAVQACSSGSGGSEVGNAQSLGPIAIATVVGHPVSSANGDATATVRSGAEVLLSANNSYGQDAPIIDFDWASANAAASSIKLLTRTASVVSFTAPAVSAPTILEFTFTAADADGSKDTAKATIDVEPIADPNAFLTYLLAPTTFRVVASTSEQLTSAKQFAIDAAVRVRYQDRQGLPQTYESVVESKSATWLVGPGVAPNPNPSNPGAAAGNTVFSFRIPGLDLDDVNAAYINLPSDDPRRNRMLDAYRVDQADVDVVVSSRFVGTSTGNPASVLLFVQDATGTAIAGPGAAGCQFTGAAMQCVIPVENLNTQGAEDAGTALAYYNTIDPGATKNTLTKWLRANCFDPSASRYAADARAVYTNNFDLGFGRDMYLKSGSRCTGGSLTNGDVASVVINYPSLLLAAKRLDPIIAVAMEYRPPADNPAGARFAKFYVFAPDEGTGEMVRVTSANFDGRGEKFVPGVCTVCHGGQPQDVADGQPYPNGGNIGAIFLPWDIDSFLFSGPDGDPQKDPSLPASTFPGLSRVDLSVLSTYTRANQEGELRNLNEAVLATLPQDTPVRRLVHDWYHGGAGSPDYTRNTLSGTFRSGYVPAGWAVDGPAGNPVRPRELYLGVIAQHCRACHTQLRVDLAPGQIPGATQRIANFESYQEFIATMTDSNQQLTDKIIAVVFDKGTMPLARLTADRLWVAPAANRARPADLLAAHLNSVGASLGGVSATRVPGRPLAAFGPPPPQVTRGQGVRMDATASTFADKFNWNLAYLGGGSCNYPNSPTFTSTAALAGQGTAFAAFTPDVPGQYRVTLSVETTGGQVSSPSAPATTAVVNNCPQSRAIDRAVIAGGNVTLNLATELQQAGDGAQTFTYSGATSGTLSYPNAADPLGRNGNVRFAPSGTGGRFNYTVTDADGEVSTAAVNVAVTQVLTANDDTPSPQPYARTSFPAAFDYEVEICVLGNDVGGAGNVTITSVGGSCGASPVGTATIVNNNTNAAICSARPYIRYSSAAKDVGPDSFGYAIRDSNPTPSLVQTDCGTVNVNVMPTATFASVANVFIDSTDVVTCMGCHSAPPRPFSYSVLLGNPPANQPNCVGTNATLGYVNCGTPADSDILRRPSNTHPNGHPTGGLRPGFDLAVPPPPPAPPPNRGDYNRILRWIEEGARNNSPTNPEGL